MATRLFGDVKMRGPATTACLLFSRFFARHSYTRVDRWSVASSCLFLAAKVEEVHRKLKDIVAAEYASQHEGAWPDPSSPEFLARREALCDTERTVLYTLEFDVAVQHPYSLITAHVKRWRDSGLFGSREEKSVEAQTIDRAAAEVAFACMTSVIGLLFTPHEVAMASLFIAVQHVARVMPLPRVREAHTDSLLDRRVLMAICDLYLREARADLATDENLARQWGGGGGAAAAVVGVLPDTHDASSQSQSQGLDAAPPAPLDVPAVVDQGGWAALPPAAPLLAAAAVAAASAASAVPMDGSADAAAAPPHAPADAAAALLARLF